MLSETVLNGSANNFTRIAGTAIQGNGKGGNGLGGEKPDASPANGLGGAGMLDWGTSVHLVWVAAIAFIFL